MLIYKNPLASKLYESLQHSVLQSRWTNSDLIFILFELCQKKIIKLWFIQEPVIQQFLKADLEKILHNK
jgi:hypothetical protein